MKTIKKSRSRVSADESKLCQYPFADGRQCRMFRHESHPKLCLFHAREELQIANSDRVGEELASYSGSFRTVTDINFVMGKLFKLVARNRIPIRNAQLLAYLAQLLLHTQKGVKHEMSLVYSHNEFARQVLAACTAARLSQPAAVVEAVHDPQQ